jgi:hypothetical protein
MNNDYSIHNPDAQTPININVTHIKIAHSFRRILKRNELPSHITHLQFNNEYNEYLDKKVLPKGLTHLFFGNYYNRSLDKKVLPKSLKYLKFGMYYDKPFYKNILPTDLTELILGDNYCQYIDKDVLPNSITHLYFLRTIHVFPELNHCSINEYANELKHELTLKLKHELKYFPKNLEYLNYQNSNYLPINSNYLPNTLKILLMSSELLITNNLPLSLEYLDFNFDESYTRYTMIEEHTGITKYKGIAKFLPNMLPINLLKLLICPKNIVTN